MRSLTCAFAASRKHLASAAAAVSLKPVCMSSMHPPTRISSQLPPSPTLLRREPPWWHGRRQEKVCCCCCCCCCRHRRRRQARYPRKKPRCLRHRSQLLNLRIGAASLEINRNALQHRFWMLDFRYQHAALTVRRLAAVCIVA